MEHPLITDVDSLNMEELQNRMADLSKKLAWARHHNQHLAGQISMALETYTNRYRQQLTEIWEKNQKPGNDYRDRINIS